MKEEKSYHTKQKQTLLDLFKSNPGKCFTSREIISDKNISMGEATVYRALSQFVKDGTIKKYSSPGSGPTYQYNPCGECDHFHMKCIGCGELFHINSPVLKSAEDSIEKDFDFLVDNTNTTLYGYCKNCRKATK